MGTYYGPIVADLFLFCYERDSVRYLAKQKQYDMIEASNTLNRYPAELQPNKANSSDAEASFLDFNLLINNGIVSTKIYT